MRNVRNRLLASLPASELVLLGRHLRQVEIEQGQTLEHPGRPIDRIYFPESGLISLIVSTSEDTTLEVATVGYEGAIGMTAGLGSRVSFIQALVQVSGTASCIPLSRFQSAANRSSRVRAIVARYGETVVGQIQQTAACNALHDASARVCRWLLHASDKTESDVIPFTQEFLGQMLGVQRTTISTVMSKFHSAGLVETRHGSIQILERAGLKRECCECYEVISRHIDRVFSNA